MEISQIVAIVIFVLMFASIIWGKVHRYISALVAAALVIGILFLAVMREPHVILDVLNISHLAQASFWVPGHSGAETTSGINWQTIIFIAGMMVMVEGMAEAGFFRWMCLFTAKLVKYKVVSILVVFMILSGILSMFIDSITVLLFLAAVTIELSRLLKFDPVPIIIAEIFASNVGGSATMSGDPPNIIIGTSFGYTFSDFITNTGPVALIGLLVALVFFYFAFRKELQASNSGAGALTSYPQPKEAIANRTRFLISTAIFLFIVVLLVTHAQTGLSVGLIGVIAAALTLLTSGKRGLHMVARMDWKTLLFFIGLFIVVGGLEQTGVLEMVASFIGNVSGGNIVIVITIILWLSAIASGLVDNIPFAATMVPIIRGLAETSGLNLSSLSWTLALGTDIGGNATPIGASSNVVGTAIAEKEGHPISWGRYMKYALPAMVLVVGICQLYLMWRYA
jgi:Na+/H+ antiporter NhaD/arsenite permease-like protein